MADEDADCGRRTRRKPSEKVAKASQALQRVRELKGKKNKYEVREEEPVYDVVDEDQYTDMVLERQRDDWIVEDVVGGYVEDGREIFDEDDEYDSEDYTDDESTDQQKASKKKRKVRRKVEESKSIEDERPSNNRNLKDMFKKISEMQPRKKMKMDEPCDDAVIDALINEAVSESTFDTPAPKPLTTGPFKLKKISTTNATKKTLSSPRPAVRRKQILADSLPDNIEDFINQNDEMEAEKGSIKEIATENIFDWNCPTTEETNEAEEQLSEPEVVEDSKNITKFFWLDATENTSVPGLVYIFGKIYDRETKEYVSCCLQVKNIERQLFLLPRDSFKSDSSKKVEDVDVKKEFNGMMKKFKMTSFKSKSTNKKYAFDKEGIPNEAKYLEVIVPPSAQVPEDLEGDTFSCVFGSHQSFLERLLLDRKLKGPSWLSIADAEQVEQRHSWCKVELSIDSMKKLSVCSDEKSRPPPVVVMALSVKTLMNHTMKTNEIFAVAGFVEDKFNLESGKTIRKGDGFTERFCLISTPSNSFNIIYPVGVTQSNAKSLLPETKLELKSSEREVLNLLMAKIQNYDPDIIVGHDIHDYDLDILLQRLVHFKVATWSKLGRVRKMNTLPSLKRWNRTSSTAGRVVADLKISARELIKVRSYDLDELCKTIFKNDKESKSKLRRDIRDEFSQDMIISCFESKTDFSRLLKWLMRDSWLVYQMILELKVLPLALQITRIAGNLFSRTLLGGRAERNEFLLLHAFHERNYIVPDKDTFDSKHQKGMKGENDEITEDLGKGAKKKAAYAGGLVLDPKIGFYTDYILILDFNSLYPSIMREFNICFTTINLRTFKPASDEDVPAVPEGTFDDENDETKPILPTQITKLIEKRREVKRMLKDPSLTADQRTQLDIQQQALKLTANSMYGCLGFSHSRFYARPLAALITYKGREILKKTKNLVESLNFEVIYGDTDSIMINTRSTDLAEAMKVSTTIQAEVNRSYKYLEIDCDAILKSMLLLKKKKYAALVVEKVADKIHYKKEMKGLDIVRRDWSCIAIIAGNAVVDRILDLQATPESVADTIHEYLKELAENLKTSGEVLSREEYVKQFTIRKSLTKDPDQYDDSKNLSHVLVALDYNECSQKKLRAGDVVPYVVCLKPSDEKFSSLPATQRVVHESKVIEKAEFEVDIDYYLGQQIHPVVARLCEPIGGTDARSIAEFLGLDSSFAPRKAIDATELIISAGKNRFDVCHPLSMKCPSCLQLMEITQPFTEDRTWSLSKCQRCSAPLDRGDESIFIERNFKLILKSFINRFYSVWATCEDPTCSLKLRLNTGPVLKKGPECPICSSAMIFDFPASQFNLQLSFFEYLFDIKSPKTEMPSSGLQNSRFDVSFTRKLLDERNETKNVLPLADKLLAQVREVKSLMGYSEVDCNLLFQSNCQIFKSIRRQT